MIGMTVFYIFFTGASGAQTIIKEERGATLPRLFTTPTPRSHIILGKFLAVALTIIVQFIVLLAFGNFVFKIYWGSLPIVITLFLGITFAATGFGLFLSSFVKTERQAGTVIGGVVTVMGMMGMMPIFVMGVPDPPKFIRSISLLVPQGWAVDGLLKLVGGGVLGDVLSNLMILILWGSVFILVGISRFRKRFN